MPRVPLPDREKTRRTSAEYWADLFMEEFRFSKPEGGLICKATDGKEKILGLEGLRTLLTKCVELGMKLERGEL